MMAGLKQKSSLITVCGVWLAIAADPTLAQTVRCTLTIDNTVHEIKYNGADVARLSGNWNDWGSQKVISFRQSGYRGGVLEISGSDAGGCNGCQCAGLLIRCSGGAWNGYVSNTDATRTQAYGSSGSFSIATARARPMSTTCSSSSGFSMNPCSGCTKIWPRNGARYAYFRLTAVAGASMTQPPTVSPTAIPTLSPSASPTDAPSGWWLAPNLPDLALMYQRLQMVEQQVLAINRTVQVQSGSLLATQRSVQDNQEQLQMQRLNLTVLQRALQSSLSGMQQNLLSMNRTVVANQNQIRTVVNAIRVAVEGTPTSGGASPSTAHVGSTSSNDLYLSASNAISITSGQCTSQDLCSATDFAWRLKQALQNV